MSKSAIPQLLSDSPPPIDLDNENEDEFGNFYANLDGTYDSNSLTHPSTPEKELPSNVDEFTRGFLIEDKIHLQSNKSIESNLNKKNYLENKEENSFIAHIKNENNFENVDNILVNNKTNLFNNPDYLCKEILQRHEQKIDPENAEIENDSDLFVNTKNLIFTEPVNETDFQQRHEQKIIPENAEIENDLFVETKKLVLAEPVNETDFPPDLSDKNNPEVTPIEIEETNNAILDPDLDLVKSSIDESALYIENKFVKETNYDLNIENSIQEFQWQNENYCTNPNNDDIEDKAVNLYDEFTENFNENVENKVLQKSLDEICLGDNNFNEEFDDFGNFASFSENISSPTVKTQQIDFKEDDDFDDFTSFTDSCQVQLNDLKISSENAFDHSKNVLHEVFPKSELDVNEYLVTTFHNSVFENLKDITETNALSFRWGQSLIQKKFLSSLNIDSRNILSGHNWKIDLPVFASNLRSSPLEPVKSQLFKTNPNENISSMGYEDKDSPFWDDKSESKPVPASDTPCQEIGEKTIPEINSTLIEQNLSLNALSLSDFSIGETLENKVSSQISDSVEENLNFLMYPLKESYITNIDKNEEFCEYNSNALSSNSLNSHLSFSQNDFHVNTLSADVNVKNIVKNMLVPDEIKHSSKNMENVITDYKIKSLTDLEETKIVSLSSVNTSDKQEEKDTNFITTDYKVEDDDFTDFVSYTPTPSVACLSQPLQPILTPIPVQAATQNTKIEWPEPGVNDNDLNYFLNNFSLLKNDAVEVTRKDLTNSDVSKDNLALNLPQTNIKNNHASNMNFKNKTSLMESQTSPKTTFTPFNISAVNDNIKIDDADEWSDFVSVEQPNNISSFSKENSSKLKKNFASHSIDPLKDDLMDNQLQKKINSTVGQICSNMRSAFINSFNDSSGTLKTNSIKSTSDFTSESINDIHKSDDEWGDFVAVTTNNDSFKLPDLDFVSPRSKTMFK